MRCLSCAPLLLICGVGGGETKATPASNFQSVALAFEYNSKQSLDIHDKIIEELTCTTLRTRVQRADLLLRT
jgi:hypothetical protein